jgi:hypothetical protein
MVVKFLNWIKSFFVFKNKNKVKKRFISDDDFNDMKKKKEDKLNSILDKIAKNGYESLSIHEKIFLDNYSRSK